MELDNPPWDSLLSTSEQEVIRRGGYGRDGSLGQRPCLLLVDCQREVVGLNEPILDQIEMYPSGIGEVAWSALQRLSVLLSEVRSARLPVIYTRIMPTDGSWEGVGIYGQRIVRRGTRDGGGEIVPVVAPLVQEPVIDKFHASGFAGTPLLSLLVARRIDTLLIGGGSTSGCVRATAVEAASLGFRVAVVGDGSFDRIRVSHASALLDIWMKYGAVLTVNETNAYVRSIAGKEKE